MPHPCRGPHSLAALTLHPLPAAARTTYVGAGDAAQVGLLHKSDPVFDEHLQLLVDGATASDEATQIQLEVVVSHFLRRETVKARLCGGLQAG